MAVRHALADTSVVNRFSDPSVAEALSEDVRAGRVALCAPVVFEVCFSARNAEDLDAMRAALDALPNVPIRPATFDRVLEVQRSLAQRGHHRAVSLVDLLVAAAAEAHGLTVVHYDHDFDLIAKVTEQPTEWVVPAGSIS